MDSQEFGVEILNSVVKAIDTNNYANLSSDIKKTVDKATQQYKEVHNINNYYAGNADNTKSKTKKNNTYNYYADPKTIEKAKQPNTKNVNNYYAQNYPNYSNIGRKTMYSSQRSGNVTVIKNNQFTPTPFMQKKVGAAGSIVGIVFSSIGMFLSGIFALVFGIISAAAEVSLSVPMIFSMVIFAICTLLLFTGISNISLVNEFKRYAKVIGDKTYITYEELSALTGQSVKTLKKKIKKFTDKGYLTYMLTDKDDTTLMFNKEVYDQYMQSQAARRELEQQRANEQTKADELNKSPEIIREGTAYIKKIREVNDMIPSKEMTEKLYKLEEIMNRIFDKVKQDPSSADELRKFMNYYLPTTTKLLDAYVDLDKQPVQGDNIKQAKLQIEEAMDTINIAFENLLDSMFQDMAWDISSDISVMKTMMAQDGLTEDGLRKNVKESSKAQNSGMATATATATATAAQSEADKDRIKLQF